MSDYLAESDLRIVDGPKPGGIYQIAANDSDTGKAALEALKNNKELVRFFTSAQ
jgi:hypothetical protein